MSAIEKKNSHPVLAAVFLSVIVFLSGLFNLDNNCNWGDDYAAYLTDGIALAEGKYEEQIHTNAFLRYGSSEEDAVHVHSFGMPLLHSLVYRLCGFDRTDFADLFVYKLPSLLLLSVMCAAYYLLLRKRFDKYISVVLTLTLCCSLEFFYAIRNLGNDVLFMAFTLLCFYAAELFTAGEEKSLFCAASLGFLLWATVSVRLNGVGVLLAVLLYHALSLLDRKKRPTLADFVPYAVFAVLYLIINCLIFPSPTSTSSVSDISLQRFRGGIQYYSSQLYSYFSAVAETLFVAPLRFVQRIVVPGKDPITIYNALNKLLTVLFFVFMGIGIAVECGRRKIAVPVFVLASFLITAGLNLGQGMRYLYSILPFLFLYFACGLSFLKNKLTQRTNKAWFSGLCTAALCCFALIPVIKADAENIKNPAREPLTAYSESAVEAYNYIADHLEKDSTVAFFKPRALYLNTGVRSFPPRDNGRKVGEGDYYLYYKPDPDYLLTEDEEENYTAVFENEDFLLLEKKRY